MAKKLKTPRPLNRRRLLCFEESVWSEERGLLDQQSVLPTVELLHRTAYIDEFVHRQVFGSEELKSYLRARKADSRARTYGLLYLAFHGSPSSLTVGNDEIDLDRLAQLTGPLPGAVVHLGSCSVLRGGSAAAKSFLEATGAAAISGYDENVDWLDSAALDLAWLGYAAHYQRLGDAQRFLRLRYASAMDALGWKAVRA